MFEITCQDSDWDLAVRQKSDWDVDGGIVAVGVAVEETVDDAVGFGMDPLQSETAVVVAGMPAPTSNQEVKESDGLA